VGTSRVLLSLLRQNGFEAHAVSDPVNAGSSYPKHTTEGV